MSPSFFKPLVACLMVLLSAQVQGQIGIIIGGYTEANKGSKQVQDAAKFAVQKKFPGRAVTFEIIDALQQQVQGYNYDLTIDVIETSSSLCSSHQYIVYQKFDGAYSLTEETDLGDC